MVGDLSEDLGLGSFYRRKLNAWSKKDILDF